MPPVHLTNFYAWREDDPEVHFSPHGDVRVFQNKLLKTFFFPLDSSGPFDENPMAAAVAVHCGSLRLSH